MKNDAEHNGHGDIGNGAHPVEKQECRNGKPGDTAEQDQHQRKARDKFHEQEGARPETGESVFGLAHAIVPRQAQFANDGQSAPAKARSRAIDQEIAEHDAHRSYGHNQNN